MKNGSKLRGKHPGIIITDMPTPLQQAEYYVTELGTEGAWMQAADEWHNSDTQEGLDYWSEVMSIIKPSDNELSCLFDKFLTVKPVKVVEHPSLMGPFLEESE